MRRALLLGAALGVINSAVVVALDWALRGRTDFGGFSYSPLLTHSGGYADYLVTEHLVNGWAAVAVVAGALIAVNVLVLVGYMVVRRRTADQ